jgi:hypothetical protein
MRFHALFASAAATATLLAQSAPCFDSNLGPSLGLTDDSVAYNRALGFTFPGPGGNYTNIDIASNGFLWLGTNINHYNGCCSGDAASFLSDDPRIAGMWMDLNPSMPTTGGGVFFNTVAATPSSPARAVITWNNVPEYGMSTLITVQVQLVSTGEILIAHNAGNGVAYAGHAPLVGVTEGLGATANVVPFASMPGSIANTGANPTAYQNYTAPPNYNLNGFTLWFLPNGQNGYIVTTVCNSPPSQADYATFGAGCLDSPLTFYEPFTWPSYAFDLSNSTISLLNAGPSYVVTPIPGPPAWFTPTSAPLSSGPYAFSWLGSWDEAVSNPISLPWTINYPSGSTSLIQVGSNGIVYLQTAVPGDDSGYYDYTYGWLNTGPSLAVAFGDQDVTASAGYGIYYDVDPSGNAVYITWITSEYLGPSQDFQVMIDAGGNIEYRYQTVNVAAVPILVGWSPGGGATDPGMIDISAAGTFLTGDGSLATTLTNTGGARPILGTTFSQDVGNIRPGSAVGLVFYGFGNLLPSGFSLAPFGAPGCTQWINLLVNQLFLVGSSTTPVALPIPNTPSLAGLMLQSQAAVLSPNANALGAVVSNGAALTLGF